MPTGQAFCAKCHTESARSSVEAMHWQALSRAHPGGRRSAGGSSRSLDSESRSCMSCHDGVNAPDPVSDARHFAGRNSSIDPLRSHPVGIPYPTGTSRRQKASFRPVAMLPEEIRLPNGTVGCGSCHNLYAKTRFRLSVPIEDSALCFSCHAMD